MRDDLRIQCGTPEHQVKVRVRVRVKVTARVRGWGEEVAGVKVRIGRQP